MLDFVARVYRGWINFLLWLILIGCTIGSAIATGYLLGGRGFSMGHAFLGFLIGAFIGLIINILGGGFIANFLNMVDNIEKIAITSGTILIGKNLPKDEPEGDALKEGDILVVNRDITLKDKIGPDGKETIHLKKNDFVKYIETINNIGLYPWYLVETEKGERGYYVSLDFSKKSEI